MIAQELEVSLHMAFMDARQKRHELITVEHLLLAMLDNPSAAEVLKACGSNIDVLRNELTQYIDDHTPTISGEDEVDTQPTLGFQRVIQRAMLHVQSSGKKEVNGANVLVAIYGEKDSHAVYFLHQQGITRLDVVNFIAHGKTAIAEGLAKRIVDKEVPSILENTVIFSLDMGTLLAGTKYRGDFEQRLKSVMKQLNEQKDAILFIDEIHTLIGAGSASGGTLDASNLLKPALSNGSIKCIGATTYQEYRAVFEKDHALTRRFQKIDVNEPSILDTINILKGLKSRFEKHHNVKYSVAAINSAAELSAKYINDRHLPDKAIDVIDEAGAAQRILPKNKQKKVITNIVAKIAKIPPKNISNDDKNALKNLERDLKAVIFGQDKAIENLASAIKMTRSGLGMPNKPIGNFLFSGPTGVGKTEVARQLAYILGIELVRIDMSEYMERHAVSRLIGAPPGYVGFDQGGLLTESVNKQPYCVLLLDEIEKAHPDIFNILLQVMDHGSLTDSNGRKTDFRNVTLIMTTNAGAESLSKTSMGFTQSKKTGDEQAEIKRLFTPEFRNRLDATVSFSPLSHDVILKVVDKFLMQLEDQLHEKKVDATFTDSLKSYLAKNGFDPSMGARPMSRLIQDTIRKALADELLFGKLTNGGNVIIDIDSNDKVKLIFEEENKVILQES